MKLIHSNPVGGKGHAKSCVCDGPLSQAATTSCSIIAATQVGRYRAHATSAKCRPLPMPHLAEIRYNPLIHVANSRNHI
jgi:hypothetical protein